jgi:predicted chitinase
MPTPIAFHQQQVAFVKRAQQAEPPAEDPSRLNFDPTPQQIVDACPDAVLETVAVNWPFIRDALIAEGFRDPATFLAAIATVYVETHIGDNSFKPIREFGGHAYFTANYEHNRGTAAQLGNTQSGDGARYCGRGYIQITGRANYRHYGGVLGIPLEAEPDLALDANVAARILAAYFARRRIPDQANEAFDSADQDWRPVRRAVNGGLLGYSEFLAVVQSLKAKHDAQVATRRR